MQTSTSGPGSWAGLPGRESGLDLLSGPHALYRHASKRARQVLNQAFFTKIYFDAGNDAPTNWPGRSPRS
jgi:hypothetical protein